mgnify:CR=1 FL=1
MGSPLAINFFKNLRRNPLIIPSSIKEGWINLYNKEDYISVYPLKAPILNLNPMQCGKIPYLAKWDNPTSTTQNKTATVGGLL